MRKFKKTNYGQSQGQGTESFTHMHETIGWILNIRKEKRIRKKKQDKEVFFFFKLVKERYLLCTHEKARHPKKLMCTLCEMRLLYKTCHLFLAFKSF